MSMVSASDLQPPFLKLSPELHLCVLGWLAAPDLIALSKTNQYLSQIFDLYIRKCAALYCNKSALFWGAKEQCAAFVPAYLERDATIKARDEYGRMPLLMAAANGEEAAVALLRKYGSNLKSTDKYGWTPLLVAAANGEKAAVKLLLENGANFEARDEWGRTPLFLAALEGRTAVVELLLKEGASVEDQESSRITPLYTASMARREALVELLLKSTDLRSISVEYAGEQLRAAVKFGLVEFIPPLLEKGADVNAIDDVWGRSPLSIAVENGEEAVIKLLRDAAQQEAA